VFQNRLKKWNKPIWIAKKIGVEDKEGYQIPLYDKPKIYFLNVQPLTSESDIQEFGEITNQIQKAVIEYDKYLGEFNEFDVAYLDGVTPLDEEINGSNANYQLYPPRNQNKVINIYFKRFNTK